ncbi:MAG: hypothetical protein COA36_16860 [Desulfotalea sp.]|nr:MAG: hypothetical protein COA36_16860 [Desulfotalea sp.]
MKKEDEFTIKIMSQIAQMFNEDSDCENQISTEDLEKHLTEFTHAMANLAPAMYYNQMTGANVDSLEFNHIANRLCFQFNQNN